ncbi:MAG: biotin--[acetyl-CoA-carboxylase] ligase [Sediminibacterium sp.]|nr:biotin--[acetyl-CoA-carboxylase] ligase [Sediminibacterium sp.]
MLPATPIITIGAPLIELPSIDSTNIYAMEQIKAGKAISGSCYNTPFQTHGKGQHGRVWESEKGQNLLCSYVLELKSLNPAKNWGPEDQKGLSAAVAIGAKAFFGANAGDETLIKLPNDIYWRDRKAGGILIENSLRGTEWTWAVIGIGFNINQTSFSPDAPNPVSLRQITGRQWEIARLQTELSKALTKSIHDWILVGEEATLENMKPLWTSN